MLHTCMDASVAETNEFLRRLIPAAAADLILDYIREALPGLQIRKLLLQLLLLGWVILARYGRLDLHDLLQLRQFLLQLLLLHLVLLALHGRLDLLDPITCFHHGHLMDAATAALATNLTLASLVNEVA